MEGHYLVTMLRYLTAPNSFLYRRWLGQNLTVELELSSFLYFQARLNYLLIHIALPVSSTASVSEAKTDFYEYPQLLNPQDPYYCCFL